MIRDGARPALRGGERTTAFRDEEGGSGNGVGRRFSQTAFCMPGTVPGGFIHQLSSTCYMPGSVLGARDAGVNKNSVSALLQRISSLSGSR